MKAGSYFRLVQGKSTGQGIRESAISEPGLRARNQVNKLKILRRKGRRENGDGDGRRHSSAPKWQFGLNT
jgi:hypothetical protein